ncbi:MAG: serine/threonine protein kinase [Calothrix sp. FI2-JRJ7]|jgi:hypothetical protein|nr:serine/threonine protein kinase [Calothrix sp. FI2-JRJ7]
MEILRQSEIIAQRYKILSILGQGGIGITYSALDIECDKHVALKVLSLRKMKDWKKMELFEREAKTLAQLNHPAIPSYYGYFQIDTQLDKSFYIVQQLAPGKSLAELIEAGWCPSEDEVREIAVSILEILTYLHSLVPPVIHRDIKPQNIIRSDDGKIFLVDFGAVAETYHNTIAGGSTIVGTLGYMAPEQFRASAVPATDLYGLGSTLLFLLTQKSPADLPQSQLKIDFRSHTNITNHFANWLDKMLEPVSSNRFPSTQEATAVLNGTSALKNYSTTKPRRPKNTSISIKNNENTLIIDIPAAVLKHKYRFGLLYSIIFGIIFVSLWTLAFEYLVFNYLLLVVGIVGVVFLYLQILLPNLWFPIMGLVYPFIHTNLYITQKYFTINSIFFGMRLHQISGTNSKIERIDIFGFKTLNTCRLTHRKHHYYFGTYLSQADKAWLIWEIREFLM